MTRRDLRSLRRATIDVLEGRQMLTVTEYIQNGNFAANGTNWTLTGDFHADAAFSTTNGFSNPGYAYLSAADGNLSSSNNLDGTLAQTVTIPSTVTSAALSFWYKTTTEETGATTDQLLVKIKNPTTGVTLSSVYTVYAATSSAYQFASGIDLSAYAGQTISISFDGHTNATNGTVFRVDNVSLQVDVPAPPPPPAVVVTPTLAYPGVPTTTSLPTINSSVTNLRWNAVSGATGYGVILSKLSGTTYTSVYNSENGPFTSKIKGTTFTPPALLGTGTYRWTVRAFDASGNPTPYAPFLYFNLNTTGYNRATGIDISHYQTVSSWANIKTNGTTSTTDDVSFVWAKATEGVGYTDTSYSGFVTGAKAAGGIAIGAYHFARPNLSNDTTAYATQMANDAVAEANYFFSKISSTLTAGNLVPMLDFEATLDRDVDGDGTNDVGLSLTSAQIKTLQSQWVNVFCDTLTASIASTGVTGLVPIVYTYTSFATSNLDSSVTKYPLWMAAYPSSAADPAIPITPGTTTATNPSSTTPWPTNVWSTWQYTSKRTVAGVGVVDSDVWNGDIASIESLKIPSIVKGSVNGTLFNDTNGDGIQNNGETGVAGRTVYIDADGDGVFDSDEVSTTTSSTGFYQFNNLLSGTYRVREVVPANYLETGVPSYTFQLAAGQALSAQSFATQPIDITPPTIATSVFAYDQSARPISIVFSEDVGASLINSDAVLTNTTTGAIVPTTLIYVASTKTAVFTPVGALANGNYTLTIAAGKISDAAGNPNATMNVNFFSLDGDIDRSGTVNFDDLILIAQNYGGTGTFAQGDLTGDGVVNFDDLIILAQNYNVTLTASIAAMRANAVAASVVGSTSTPTRKAAPKKTPAAELFS